MDKYNIVFIGGVAGTSDDPILDIVNEEPATLPPPGTVYSHYKLDGTTLVSISTQDTNGAVLVTAPPTVGLGEQTAEVPLAVDASASTTVQWQDATSGIQLSLRSNRTTELSLVDMGLPPQRLRIKVLAP